VSRRWLWPALLAAAALAYPWLLDAPFYQRMGAFAALYAIAACAWNLVGGYAGQASVGHVVFFGCGAYASVVAYAHWQLPPVAGLPLGVGVAVLIAAVIGVPTLRLSGHYFTMATVAIGEFARIMVTNTEWLGGAQGLSGPVLPRTWMDLSFRSDLPLYYIFLGVLALVLLATWRIEVSRMGFYLRAIKGSERAARSLGVPVGQYKLYAFMLSAAFTAVAGSLYLLLVGFVDPGSGLDILVSVKMLIVAALGGAGTLLGPVLGAVILIPLEELTNKLFGSRGTGLTFAVYGAIIVLIARFQPGGLIEWWRIFVRLPWRGKATHAGILLFAIVLFAGGVVFYAYGIGELSDWLAKVKPRAA